MTEKQTTLLNPTKVREALVKSREFFEGLPNATTAEQKSRLLGFLAAQWAERRREELPEADRLSLELFELSIPFANAQTELSTLRADKSLASVDASEQYEAVTRFNHTVKAIYEHLPDLPLDAVPRFVGQVVIEQLGAARAQAAINDVRSALWGMRKEVAWEQIARQVPGVEVIQGATLEQEQEHIDYTVVYRGRQLAVDVKSSQSGVTGALEKGNTNAVQCPVPSDAFGEKFALSEYETDRSQYIEAVRYDLDKLLVMQHNMVA